LPTTPTISTSGSTTICQGSSVTLTSSTATSYLWSNSATTKSIIVSSSGNYSVTIKDANGCAATSAVKSVTVNPLPTVNAGMDKTIYIGYLGDTIRATTNGGISYSWSPSSGLSFANVLKPLANPTTITTYTITVTNTNGCLASDAVVVNVTNINSLGSGYIINQKMCMCLGGITFVDDANVNADCKDDKSACNRFREGYIPVLCSNPQCPPIAGKKEFEDETETEEQHKQNLPLISLEKAGQLQFEAFPNPFSDKNTLQFSIPENSKVRIEIYTITGQMIEMLFDQAVEKDKTYTLEYRANNLPAGVYFYRFATNAAVLNKKIVIVR